jgi:hypothetical protein
LEQQVEGLVILPQVTGTDKPYPLVASIDCFELMAGILTGPIEPVLRSFSIGPMVVVAENRKDSGLC